jgi:hypothetical protein
MLSVGSDVGTDDGKMVGFRVGLGVGLARLAAVTGDCVGWPVGRVDGAETGCRVG